jgi:hypothetical protein
MVYLNVFECTWMYLNILECIHSIFECTYNIFVVYFNVFESVWMYLNVFECTYNILVVYFNVPIIYFNAFIVCFNFNVFECIYRHCNWISPSLSHCNVFAMHTHLHIFFSLYTMTPFPTCYTTTFIFFHSRWSIPTFIQSTLTFHIYTSPHIPHSMSSLVARSIAEPKFKFIELFCIILYFIYKPWASMVIVVPFGYEEGWISYNF